MREPLTSFRKIAAVALVTNALLSAVSVALQPDLPSNEAARFAAIDTPSAAVSATAFVLAQLPFVLGILGIGWLLAERSPRLARAGVMLAVIGGFGHAVFGGISLAEVVLAGDTAHRAVLAAAFTYLQTTPVMIFALLGLGGTVLGLLLLSIALFRARVRPVWGAPVLWAFLVLEFAGSAVSQYAAYLAVVLLGAVFMVLARELWPTVAIVDETTPVGQLTRER